MVALEEDQKFQIVLANLKLVWNIGGPVKKKRKLRLVLNCSTKVSHSVINSKCIYLLVEEDSFFFCLKKSKDGANLRDVLAVFMTNTAGRRNFPFSTSLY